MATIYDVARKAGVSPKTVSRVMNGDAPVNEKTRKAVEAAMGALSYVPSSAARSMRSNKTGLVGLITGAISGTPSATELTGLPDLVIVQAIQKKLAANGITLLISDTGGERTKVAELSRTLNQHRVEALIYVADYHRKIDLPDEARQQKLLLVNCFDEHGTPTIVPDDYMGQKSMTERLIESGHRRIGFLTLPQDLVAYELRLGGYQDALSNAGIEFDSNLVQTAGLHHSGPQEVMLISEAVDYLMVLDDPPTVICCGNDRMALQLYGVLRTRGVRVPEQLSVAGFDDYKLISETLYPPLTTAVLPYQLMGTRAAEWILAQIRGEEEMSRQQIQRIRGPVVWRQSVIAQQQ